MTNNECICYEDDCVDAACYHAFDCWDCNINTSDIEEYYMVHDEIWEAATEDVYRDIMLCIGCLEARLGGKLMKDDFTDAPVNGGIFPKSKRLAQRLAAASNF